MRQCVLGLVISNRKPSVYIVTFMLHSCAAVLKSRSVSAPISFRYFRWKKTANKRIQFV